VNVRSRASLYQALERPVRNDWSRCTRPFAPRATRTGSSMPSPMPRARVGALGDRRPQRRLAHIIMCISGRCV